MKNIIVIYFKKLKKNFVEIYKLWYEDKRGYVIWWFIFFRDIYRVIRLHFAFRLWKFFARLQYLEALIKHEFKKIRSFIKKVNKSLKYSKKRSLLVNQYASYTKYYFTMNLSLWIGGFIIFLLLLILLCL